MRSESRQRAKFDLTALRAAFDVRSVTVDGVGLPPDGIADLSDVSTIRMDVVARSASADDAHDPAEWLVYRPVADLPAETPVATGAISATGAVGIPDHPSVALSENDLPLAADTSLDPRVDHLLRLSGDSVERITSVSVGDRRLPVRTGGEQRFVVAPAREFAP